MDVLFLAADLQDWEQDGRRMIGGSGWYRSWLPAEALADRRGHGTAVCGESAVLADGRICGLADGELLEPADVVVLQRPFTPGTHRIIAGARQAGQAVVVDVDDHYDGVDPANQAFLRTRHSRDHLRAAMRAATLVTTTTPELRELLLRYHPTVAVIGNAVNLDDPAWQPAREVNQNPPKVVGWVGMTGTRSGDLEILRGILGPALARHGWRFQHRGHADGATPAAEQLGLDDDLALEPGPSLPPWRVPELYTGLGLVLVPLADVPFNGCKSPVNGLNAGAAGLPYLASRTPAYAQLGGGPTCRRPRDWIRQLDRLLGDDGYRSGWATCSRRAAEDNTMAVQVHRWETVLLRAALSP